MKRAPILTEPTTYTIDKDSIAYKTESTSVQTNWKNVVKVIETDDYFFLHTNLRSFHFLAKDGFASSKDIESLKGMIRANNIKAYLK